MADADDLAASQFSSSLDEAVEGVSAPGKAFNLIAPNRIATWGIWLLQLGDPLAAVGVAAHGDSDRALPDRSADRAVATARPTRCTIPLRPRSLKKVDGNAEEIRRLREEEVDLLARDAKLLPTDAAVRYMRGRLLYLLDRQDEARQAFIEACELAPERVRLLDVARADLRKARAVGAVGQRAPADGATASRGEDWKGIFLRVKQAVEAAGGR